MGKPAPLQSLRRTKSQDRTAPRKKCQDTTDIPRIVFQLMETATLSNPHDGLAINGGERTVTAPGPASWLLGPSEIGQEEIDAVVRVMKSKRLFRFLKDRKDSSVAQFEDLFAEKSGVKNVLAVNSGTSALICGLVGIGVSQGDEVLVPAYTYIATAAAVLALGAIPILVEVDDSLTMDPLDLEAKITPRTRAIIPVHMRGMPCDMEAIMGVAGRHNLMVLEDCAQANGAIYHGRAVGTWGNAGAFSLQEFKIITAGEGGAVVSNDKSVFDRAAVYHDSAYAFWMEGRLNTGEGASAEVEAWKQMCFLGENYRQSEVHGAIAFEQLKKRDRILSRTRAIKRKLSAACQGIPGSRPEKIHDRDGECGISLALFMGSPEEAVRLSDTLRAEGVSCGTRFSRDIPDRHIFFHWDYILEHRSPHRHGFPWTSNPAHVPEYTRDMCPKTIDWMERAVIFSIAQGMSDTYVDQVCLAIDKVAKGLRPVSA